MRKASGDGDDTPSPSSDVCQGLIGTMRIAIDVQLAADGNRTGLYNCLRSTIRELRPLVNDEVWLFAEPNTALRAAGESALSEAMDGARVRFFRQPPRL